MFIQGDLQAIFDALYSVGAIDPVLKLDWNQVTNEMMQNPNAVSETFQQLNACSGNRDMLVQMLNLMEKKTVSYIAMEVAREFCEFQDRKELH